MKKKRKSWRIEIGKTPECTNIFFGDEEIGFIQSLDFHLSTDTIIPTLRLTVVDPKLVVKGNFGKAYVTTKKNKALIVSGSVCPKCGMTERIENKSW